MVWGEGGGNQQGCLQAGNGWGVTELPQAPPSPAVCPMASLRWAAYLEAAESAKAAGWLPGQLGFRQSWSSRFRISSRLWLYFSGVPSAVPSVWAKCDPSGFAQNGETDAGNPKNRKTLHTWPQGRALFSPASGLPGVGPAWTT